MSEPVTAVMMAGGKGTRIASLFPDLPKPMIPVCGKPVLQYQVECLARQGIRDFIFVTGYLKEAVSDYFGDGSSFGVSIRYVQEDTPLGTAGALYYLKSMVQGDFFLINGDIMLDIDALRYLEFHRRHGGIASILTHPNSHPYDSALIEADENCAVTRWIHKEEERTWYKNRVNAGIHILSDAIFPYLESRGFLSRPEKLDLDRDIFKPMIDSRLLYAYDSPEYVKDMGTPERYRTVTEDVTSGKMRNKNLQQLQKAVFLDRDGTINEPVPFLNNIDDFVLIDGVAESIRALNDSGALVIVTTNQPVIARGELTVEELTEIHNKMETLLGREGAYVDAIYYCPHHPDSGFAGEVKELKIPCECRKPKPGMLLEAASKYHIDLSTSVMVGDGKNDMLCGEAAGCETAGLVNAGGSLGNFHDLKEFTDYYLKNQGQDRSTEL